MLVIVAYTVSKLTDYSAAALEKAAAECIRACTDEATGVRDDGELKAFRDRWMGRKNGVLTQINDLWLKSAPKDAKREAGIRVNELKTRIQELVDGAHVVRADGSAADQQVDISLPGIRRPIGAEHPVVKTTNEMVRVFQKLGYSVAEGPVVETDYYNFEALNFPPNHPARDTQDTLFIAGQQSKAAARALAAAHAHFSGADSNNGEDATATSHCDSRNGSSQRSSGCQPLANVSSDRRARGRHQHYVWRFEGHARSCHEGVFRIDA